MSMPRRAAFSTLNCPAGARFAQWKGAPLCTAPFRFRPTGRRSGLHGRKRIAVAVLGQRADIREAEMIAGDHALFGDHAIEEGAARGFRLRTIRIEAREIAGIAHEQLVDAGDVALDEEL